MSLLKKTLKPFQSIDEAVLRQYTKIAKSYEDKGKSRYTLARYLSAVYMPLDIAAICIPGAPIVAIEGFIYGSDLGRNLLEPKYERKDVTDGAQTINNPALYLYSRMHNVVRTPMFFLSLGLIVKGASDVVNYFQTNDATNVNSAAYALTKGVSLFALSSSMYIKASDPKLLQKDPLTKKISNWIKEKISDVVPTPEPTPVPIGNKDQASMYLL